MKEFELEYGFRIGVILRKKVFEESGETLTFKMNFICVGFSEDYVHYLPKRGPVENIAPSTVAKVERSLRVGVLLYPEIEQLLLKV